MCVPCGNARRACQLSGAWSSQHASAKRAAGNTAYACYANLNDAHRHLLGPLNVSGPFYFGWSNGQVIRIQHTPVNAARLSATQFSMNFICHLQFNYGLKT